MMWENLQIWGQKSGLFCLEGEVTCMMLCCRSENDIRSYFDLFMRKREVLCYILWGVLYLLLIQRWVVPKLCFQCIHSFTRKWLSAWKGGLFSLFNVAVFFCPSRTLIIWKMKWNLFSIPSCLSFSQKAVSREYQCCLT